LNTPIKLLCSPSIRTQQSADLLAEKLTISERISVDSIYEGSVATLLEVLETHNGDVMLVGHNPGFEALLAFLCTGQSGSFRGMSPGSIAWVSVQIGDLSPGSARLQHFHSA
jgi:phosphohistidine phosphatase